MNYMVLINNKLQMRGRNPVFASMVNNKWEFVKVMSRGNVTNISDEIHDEMQKIFRKEYSHYLKPFTIRRNFHEAFRYESNELLRVLNIKSEVYELQVELHKSGYMSGKRLKLMNRDLGEHTDVTEFFESDQEHFLTEAVIDYALFLHYIEHTRSHLVLMNTYNLGIAFMVDNKRWMNLLNLKVTSVDNPLSYMSHRLMYSKIVQMFEDKPREIKMDEPQIFKITERGGHILYYAATPKDTLTLLNIILPKPVDISSVFAYQLLGYCYLKALGFAVKTNALPTTAPLFMSLDADNKPLSTSFDRKDLSGSVVERSVLASFLEDELGGQLAGEYLPEFERMRLT